MNQEQAYLKAARLILESERLTAFTGAGISVESGVPPFRGKGGLWETRDPIFLDIGYFKAYPDNSWEEIKEIFYDTLGTAQPNEAHRILARWDATIITQNIDNLHQLAGSKRVYEFHGSWRDLLCLKCGERFPAAEINLQMLPPICGNCGGLLKPDFVFFGEPIPDRARELSFEAAEATDVMLVIGSTGQVTPACYIPYIARRSGAHVIEINPEPSAFTDSVTNIYLQDKATVALTRLDALLETLTQ